MQILGKAGLHSSILLLLICSNMWVLREFKLVDVDNNC